MSEHTPLMASHPVDQIEPDVAAMFKRTMKKADAMNRLMEPGEEFNLTHMSVAVSMKRIADGLDRIGLWLFILTMVTPAILLGCVAALVFMASRI